MLKIRKFYNEYQPKWKTSLFTLFVTSIVRRGISHPISVKRHFSKSQPPDKIETLFFHKNKAYSSYITFDKWCKSKSARQQLENRKRKKEKNPKIPPRWTDTNVHINTENESKRHLANAKPHTTRSLWRY